MESLLLLASFWNWLPAFRAIGETSHLPTAARALHVTPSALSRALRQLEQALGRPLFRRTGRRLELAEDGEWFLAAVRDAMRRVHEATLELRGEKHSGPLLIASGGVATTVCVLPALLALHARYPDLQPTVVSDFGDLTARLMSGRLDIAFHSTRVAHPRLRSVDLGRVAAGVYCGPRHQLYARRRVTLDDVLAADFVAPPADAQGNPQDGWPSHLPRRCAVYVDQMRVGGELCLSAPVLAVLPDPVAASIGHGRLRRLPIDVVPSTPVFATLRPCLGRPSRAELLLAEVQVQLRQRPASASGRREQGS